MLDADTRKSHLDGPPSHVTAITRSVGHKIRRPQGTLPDIGMFLVGVMELFIIAGLGHDVSDVLLSDRHCTAGNTLHLA